MTEEMKLDIDSAVTSVGMMSPHEMDILSLGTPKSPKQNIPIVSPSPSKARQESTTHVPGNPSVSHQSLPPHTTSTSMGVGYTYVSFAPEEDDKAGGMSKCHAGLYKPSQPDLVQTAEAVSSGITSALHTISMVSSLFPNGKTEVHRSSKPSGTSSNYGCNINDTCMSLDKKEPPVNSTPVDRAVVDYHPTEEKKDEIPSLCNSDDNMSESGIFPPLKIFDSRLPTPQKSENGSQNSTLHRPIAIPAGVISPENTITDGNTVGNSLSDGTDSPPMTASRDNQQEKELDEHQEQSQDRDYGMRLLRDDQQQYHEEQQNEQHVTRQQLENPPPVQAEVGTTSHATAVADDDGAEDGDDAGDNGKKQLYVNSSPMARMRDHGAQRATTLEEDGSKNSKQKSQEEIKAEKQRRWKRQLKKAKAKKRQERRELEDENYSNITRRPNESSLVDIVLRNIVPKRERAFFQGLIQYRCGDLADIVSDSEDYSADSSSAASAISSEMESRGSEGLGSRRRRSQRKDRRRRSADVVYGMKSSIDLKSRSRSEASQSQPSSEEGSFTRRSSSSRDFADDGDHGSENRRDPSQGAPLIKGGRVTRKDASARYPSPARSIPTTHLAESEIVTSPQSSLPSYASDHSIISSPIGTQTKVLQDSSRATLLQPTLGHSEYPPNLQMLPTLLSTAKGKSQGTSAVDNNSKTNPVPEPELPLDKSFVKNFIQEIVSQGIELQWHKEQVSMFPSKVNMTIKPGYRKPNGCFCGPRLGWFDVDDADDTFGIDLFDIRSLERPSPIDLQDYPYAIPSRTIVLKSSRLGDFVFEATTEAVTRRFIHGMRWVVARLAFNLVIGNLDVSCELLDVGVGTDNGKQRAPETPLEEAHWTNAMNDVTNQLMAKSI